MKLLLASLALYLAVLPGLSSAGVIYEWKAVNNEAPRNIKLYLEFDYATVDSGSFNHTINPTGGPYDGTDPQYHSGLMAFQFEFPTGPSISYRRGSYFSPAAYMNMSVRFEPGGFLSGSISVYDVFSHVVLAGSRPFFTILDADSDYPHLGAGCGWATGIKCSGAKGQIRRTDIPEPASLALLGVGLASIAGIRRRKLV